MREAWIYGSGEAAPHAARMLAELAFIPRHVPGEGTLRPSRQGSVPAYPSLALVLVAGSEGQARADELLRLLRDDAELCDVPRIAAVDPERARSSISTLDADEIIVHPLSVEELGVRIARARSRHGILTCDDVRMGSLEIDLAAYEVRLDGEPIELTHMEYQLLELLVTHPQRVYSRERLLSRIWGSKRDASARSVDGHVGRLRAKLGPEHGWRICTVRNVGYRFEL